MGLKSIDLDKYLDPLSGDVPGQSSGLKIKGVVDVIFLIDVSGSMGPAIDKLTDNIETFIENIDDNLVKEARIKIGSFSDIEVDPEEFSLNLNRPFRNKKEIVKIKDDLRECREIVAKGLGGDEPESSLDAIYKAIDEFKEDWSKRRRCIVMFTDAHSKPINLRTIPYGSEEDRFNLLVQKILENHIDLFIYAPLDRNFSNLSNEAPMRVIYEAINKTGTSPVEALRSLDFSRVLETLGKTVSQPSVE